MTQNVSSAAYAVKTGRVFDYVPGVSTVTNLVDLFIMCVVLPFLSPKTIGNSRYFTHLDKDKTLARCLLLIVLPVLANLLFSLYDLAQRKYDNPEYMLNELTRSSYQLNYLSQRLKDDSDFMLTAAKRLPIERYGDGTPPCIYHAVSYRLQTDPGFVLKLVTQNGLELRQTDHSLTQHPNFPKIVLAAVTQNGLAFKNVPDMLIDHPQYSALIFQTALAAFAQNGLSIRFFPNHLKRGAEYLNMVKVAVAQNGLALADAGPEAQNNPEIVEIAMKQNPQAFRFASQWLRNDPKLIHMAVTSDGLLLEHAGPLFRATPDVVSTAMGQNVWALKFAGDGVFKTIIEDTNAVLPLLKRSIHLIDLIPEDGLRKNADFMLEAIGIHPVAFAFAHKSLKDDPNFVQRANALLKARASKADAPATS